MFDDRSRSGWSVVLRGVAQDVTADTDLVPATLGARPWAPASGLRHPNQRRPRRPDGCCAVRSRARRRTTAGLPLNSVRMAAKTGTFDPGAGRNDRRTVRGEAGSLPSPARERIALMPRHFHLATQTAAGPVDVGRRRYRSRRHEPADDDRPDPPAHDRHRADRRRRRRRAGPRRRRRAAHLGQPLRRRLRQRRADLPEHLLPRSGRLEEEGRTDLVELRRASR